MTKPRTSRSKFNNKKPRRGSRYSESKNDSRDSQSRGAFQPRVHPKLIPVLEEIGTPQKTPFVADPFQAESVEMLQQADVVVSAPTGSGKTWIAEQAIRRTLESGQRAWYASPLKALSNAKYHEFGDIFGADQVGILTGDRKENTHAKLVVGTTEILRNQLYDAMYRGKDINSGLVVLDEAHYLGDPDRGVVWEEVIIYLPVRVRLLMLSATVENASQIARWLAHVRGAPCKTVISNERPVPLYPLFMFPDGELSPLRKDDKLFPKVRHFVDKDSQNRGRGPVRDLPPVSHVLSSLDHADLLPAIFFLKSRADCDAALTISAGARIRLSPEHRDELNNFIDQFVKDYPFLARHPHLNQVRNLAVASHHAGHLPHWKLMVERLMQKGLLRAIFSTSTVAAGVNFPARTVVVIQSDRFNGREFVELRATDLLQMTGRAGRRGMDKIGFCLAVPGPYNNIPLVASLLNSNPEPIESQLSINFSMVLNLLLSHRPAEIKQLLSLSFATFQRMEQRQKERKQPRSDTSPRQLMQKISVELQGSFCPGAEEAVIRRRRMLQLEELHTRLVNRSQAMAYQAGFWGAMNRGRVIMDMFGTLAAVLRREGSGEDAGVLAVSLIPDRRLQKGKPRLQFIPLDEVAGVYAEVISLPHTGGGKILAQAIMDQLPEEPTPLPQPELEALGRIEAQKEADRIQRVEEELGWLPCQACPITEKCLRGKGDLKRLLNKAEKLLNRMQEESHSFWFDFVRHVEFLRTEGFVDSEGQLTTDGLWASKLRLDQPIPIAEAIRRGALPEGDPVLLAGLLALFVDDRERETETHYVSERLREGIRGLKRTVGPMMDRMRQWGFVAPLMPLSAASAVFVWALGAEFNESVSLYGGAEGDLAQCIYRTADNLRQLISLSDSHPKLAANAKEAVDLLLRPPVVVPT